jgi:adenylate cyclase
MTFGRRESCDVTLRFANISGQHCEFAFTDGYWTVRDLGSTNGVKVNGSRVQAKILRPGDQVAIANHRYTIAYKMLGGAPVDDQDEDLSQSLLEKSGLSHKRSRFSLGADDDADE